MNMDPIWVKKMCVHVWSSISLDPPLYWNLDKCCRDKCCLVKYPQDSCQLIQITQPTNLKNLAEFWPVTLEIWPHIAIILKLGQMLPGQMSLRKLPMNTESPTNQPSKFGWILTSNIRDMVSYCHYTETWTNVAWSNVPEIVANEYR